jgi:hypothetical protein
VIPSHPVQARAIIQGERLFSNTGCADCHVPALPLNSTYYSEPNPYNPDGNLRPEDVANPFKFDLTSEGIPPRLERRYDGTAVVRAFTDLKRYNLCDDELQHFCNEQVVQAGIPTDEFLTRRLWDVGNSAPYGHVGDLTTITEAIYYHGGDARASRDAFFELSESQQAQIVEFLKSLQILPENTPFLVVDENFNYKNKAALRREMLGEDAQAEATTVNRRR